MAERAIKRFIEVEIRKDTPKVSAASFGIPILISNSNSITTAQRVKRFTTLAGVEALFADTTEEWKAAVAYFSQDPFLENQPEELLIGRYVEAPAEVQQAIAATQPAPAIAAPVAPIPAKLIPNI